MVVANFFGSAGQRKLVVLILGIVALLLGRYASPTITEDTYSSFESSEVLLEQPSPLSRGVPPNPIRKRALPAPLPADIQAGQALICMMNNTGNSPGAWPHNIHDSDEFGWTYHVDHEENSQLLYSYDLGAALNDLKVSNSSDDWTYFKMANNIDTKDLVATGAEYYQFYNIRNGVIIGTYSASPEYVNKKRNLELQDSQITPLRRWSDVIWLIWQEIHSGGATTQYMNNIEHIFRTGVQTSATKKHIQDVMGWSNPDGQIQQWPGDVLSLSDPATSDQFKALLNCPHGVSVPYLLAEHQTAPGGGRGFDQKIIDTVHIFKTTWHQQIQYNLYFHVIKGPLSDRLINPNGANAAR